MRYHSKGFVCVEALIFTESYELGLLSSFYRWGNWGTEIEVKQSAQDHTLVKGI